MPKTKKKGKSKGKGKGKTSKPKKCCNYEKECEDMSYEDKIKYLVSLDILQNINACNELKYNDFITKCDYIASTKENIDILNIQPEINLQHSKQFCIEFGTINLSCKFLRENINENELIKSILLYGPKGAGKTMLSQIIAHTTKSKWFNLTINKLINNELITKDELTKIIHITFDIANYLNPSIIYIDNIEELFLKKTKNADIPDYSKFRKDLVNHVSLKINKENRTLIIGNTSLPYHNNIDLNEFKKFFILNDTIPLMCYVPYPNYATRKKLFEYFINKKGLNVVDLSMTNKQFQLANLVFLSEGYTTGSIKQCINDVLNDRRIDKYKRLNKLFNTKEFLVALSNTIYTYKDDHQSFNEFTANVTQRDKQIAEIKAKIEAEKMAAENGDNKKDDKKKGKKKK